MSIRSRRQRRQMRAMLAHGAAAKPTHKLQSGRTGHGHTRRLKTILRREGKRGQWRIVSQIPKPARLDEAS
jgi:hypothetical protein